MKEKPIILIIFYSRYGNTVKMAEAISEGAKSANGITKMMRISDSVPREVVSKDNRWNRIYEDLEKRYPPSEIKQIIEEMTKADAIIFGSPTRFGNMAAPMKEMWDRTSSLWLEGKLIGKVGGVFTGASSVHGGQETTAVSMMFPMLHHGMIIVGPAYDIPELLKSGSPYGPSTIVGPNSDTVTETDFIVARALGKKISVIASKLS